MNAIGGARCGSRVDCVSQIFVGHDFVFSAELKKKDPHSRQWCDGDTVRFFDNNYCKLAWSSAAVSWGWGYALFPLCNRLSKSIGSVVPTCPTRSPSLHPNTHPHTRHGPRICYASGLLFPS